MTYDYGLWGLVAIHVGWLMLFLLAFLRPGAPREWRSLGLFSGFVVALYVEMYGFPLTLYLLTRLLPLPDPFAHGGGNLWATLALGPAAARPLMLLGDLLLLLGLLALAAAWRTLYRGRALVTRGLYRVVRHPQYSALLLLILGALIQWPTLPTLVMAPILMVAYVRLAWREERELETRFGAAYREYRRHVPGFVPALPLPRTRARDARAMAVSRK